MNVALEDTEEWANGRVTARYGDCFVRGNNGMFSLLPTARDIYMHTVGYGACGTRLLLMA